MFSECLLKEQVAGKGGHARGVGTVQAMVWRWEEGAEPGLAPSLVGRPHFSRWAGHRGGAGCPQVQAHLPRTLALPEVGSG